jgi:type I restriction enzyme, S subunit
MNISEHVSFAEAPFEIIDGDRGKNYPKQEDFSEAGYCLFLSATNVTKAGFDFGSCQFIDEKKDALLNKGKLQREDIVLTTRGTIGNTAYFNDTVPFDHLRINSGMVILRCDQTKLIPAFLYHFVRSPIFFSQVNGLRSGVAQPQLPIRDMRQIKFPLPPLPIQHRIAGILSAYDDLIENSQRRIKILESMARALYREWFVHFRFPGHESVPRIPSPMGEIPQGWEVRLVEEIVKRIPVGKKYDQKTVASTGTVPVFDQGKSGIIGYHDDDPGVVASETAPVIVFANHTCYQRIIHIPFSAIQNVLPFVPSPLLYRDIYWLHWATDGLVVFNDYKGHWPEFAAKTLIVPNAEMCQQFGEFAAPLSLHILRLERQIQNLRRTRDLLLPRLLSGQINVESLQ